MDFTVGADVAFGRRIWSQPPTVWWWCCGRFPRSMAWRGCAAGTPSPGPDLTAALAAACMTTAEHPGGCARRVPASAIAPFLADCRRRILASRTRITTELARLGAQVRRATGQFRVLRHGHAAGALHRAHARAQQHSRRPALCALRQPGCRITIGTEPEVTAFLEALRRRDGELSLSRRREQQASGR